MEFVTAKVKMSYRKHQQSLSPFFSINGELVSCNDVEGILQELGCTHNPEEWRFFLDSSKLILKAVLLHNGNIHLSIPTARSVHMMETYKNMDLLLKSLSYSKYGWKICGDLKVLELFLGTVTQSVVVFFMTGIAEQKTNITKLKTGPSKEIQFQRKMCQKTTAI